MSKESGEKGMPDGDGEAEMFDAEGCGDTDFRVGIGRATGTRVCDDGAEPKFWMGC